MFKLKSYYQPLNKTQSEEDLKTAIQFQIGISAPGSGQLLPINFIMDTGLLNFAIGITTELANELNIQPFAEAKGTQADSSIGSFEIGRVDIAILDTVLTNCSALIGTSGNFLGLPLIKNLNILLIGGEVKFIELNKNILDKY